MPTTNRSITIEPAGRSVVVDITGGTLYEHKDSGQAVRFPEAITGTKAFWVADTATYTVTVRTEVGVVVASTTAANTDPHAVVNCDFRLVAAQNVLVSSTLVEVVPNLKVMGRSRSTERSTTTARRRGSSTRRRPPNQPPWQTRPVEW